MRSPRRLQSRQMRASPCRRHARPANEPRTVPVENTPHELVIFARQRKAQKQTVGRFLRCSGQHASSGRERTAFNGTQLTTYVLLLDSGFATVTVSPVIRQALTPLRAAGFVADSSGGQIARPAADNVLRSRLSPSNKYSARTFASTSVLPSRVCFPRGMGGGCPAWRRS